MSNYRQNLVNILIVAVFATLAMASSFYRGITTGNDYRQHFQFAHTISASISSYEFYPSFAHRANEGLGDVALRFYPPLTYYVISLMQIVSGDWYIAALSTFWLIFFVGGMGVFLLCREGMPREMSLAAAAIYTFAPYHLNEIYNNFLLAEFGATAVLPFCFLFVARVCRQGGWRNSAGLAAAYGLLILTHLPLTIIGSITLALFALFMIEREKAFRSLLQLLISVGGGLILSSFYWVRMVRELSWLKHSDPVYFSDLFSFERNFLFQPANWLNFSDDILNLWLADLMLVAMIAVSIPSAIYLVKRRNELPRLVKASAAVLFTAIFMATPLSAPLWKWLSFVQRVQFPWRWLAVVSLAGSVFAAYGIMRAAESMKRSSDTLLTASLGIVLLVFLFMGFFIVKSASYVEPAVFYEQTRNVGEVRSYEGWWPVWATDAAFTQGEQAIASERAVTVNRWESLDRDIAVEPGPAASLRVRTFFYPHWKATVNNLPVEVSPSESGLIAIPLSTGRSDVRLYFEESAVNRAAFYISSAAWVILLLGLPLSLLANRRD